MHKVILFGATGMIGQGVLHQCLEDPRIENVLLIGRNPSKTQHPKVTEVIHDNFQDLTTIKSHLVNYNACFYCLGISAVGLSEREYERITFDFTLAAAETIIDLNPDSVFCYISGMGADSTEKGKIMWARIKGKTENALLNLPFRSAFIFRPGFVQPLDGIRSRTWLYNLLYTLLSPFYPLLKRLLPGSITTTRNVGRAMIQVVSKGYRKSILSNKDINLLGNVETS